MKFIEQPFDPRKFPLNHKPQEHVPKIKDKFKCSMRRFKSVLKQKTNYKALPEKVDLSCTDKIPVYNQGNLGSCVANSASSCIALRRYQKTLQGSSKNLNILPSRLYIYSVCREKIYKNINQDCGMGYIDLFKTLDSYKYCKEETWPYVENKFYTLVPKTIIDQTIKINYPKIQRTLLVGSYSNPKDITIDDIKLPLSLGKPVLTAFNVYDNFYNITSNGIMPKPAGSIAGMHSVFICGFDDTTKMFKLSNSWSSSWGNNGFFYVSYDWILDYFGEMYSIDNC